MNQIFRHFSIIFLGFLILTGCSSEKTLKNSVKDQNQEKIERQIKNHQRDLALQHYVNGMHFESKGELANAILEYQDALRYDPNAMVHFAISKNYAALNKHHLAASHAAEAVRLDSLNLEYRENLALIYINAQQYDHAVREFGEVLKIDPKHVSALFHLARLYQKNNPLRALEIYDRLINQEGGKWEFLIHTAEIFSALGRWNEAAERIERMLVLDPGNYPLRLQLAETYAKGGKKEEAFSILEHLVKENPNDLAASGALADIYLDRGDFHLALDLYTKLLQKDRNNPEVKIRMGMAYFARIRTDSTFLPLAKEIFEEVRNLAPRDWRAHWYLGAIASMESQDSLAAHHFENVLELEERNNDAWWFVATYHFERSEFDDALSVTDRAIKALPQEPRFYFLKGLLFGRLENHEGAIENYEKALSLKPDDLNTIGSLALSYDAIKRHDKSDPLYERALDLDPDSPLILNNYSYSLAERSMLLDRALEMSTRAVESEPENAAYLDTLGWIYFKIGNYMEAERYIAKAVSLGASAVVVEHLGDVYFKLGNKEKAQEFWIEAFDMDPTNETLKAKIARGTLW